MGFVEDNFSTDQGRGDGFRMIQVHYTQAHLLLCGPCPSKPRPVPVPGLEVEDPCSKGTGMLILRNPSLVILGKAGFARIIFSLVMQLLLCVCVHLLSFLLDD